jgi:hypothetical protein
VCEKAGSLLGRIRLKESQSKVFLLAGCNKTKERKQRNENLQKQRRLLNLGWYRLILSLGGVSEVHREVTLGIVRSVLFGGSPSEFGSRRSRRFEGTGG